MLGYMVYIKGKPIMWSEDLKMLRQYAARVSQSNPEIRPIYSDPITTITKHDSYIN